MVSALFRQIPRTKFSKEIYIFCPVQKTRSWNFIKIRSWNQNVFLRAKTQCNDKNHLEPNLEKSTI